MAVSSNLPTRFHRHHFSDVLLGVLEFYVPEVRCLFATKISNSMAPLQGTAMRAQFEDLIDPTPKGEFPSLDTL